MNPPSTPALGFREVLAIPSFRRLWIAILVSIFGDFLAIFAVFSVATFRFHASAAQISFILVAYMLPLAVVSPLAGVLVDRWNLKVTMITSDLIRGSLALLLVFATDLNHYYMIFCALSVVSAFFVPSQTVALRTLVPQNALMSANALISQAMQVTQIVTPAIAGILVDKAGPNFSFLFDSASFFFSASMVWLLPIHRQAAPAKSLKGVHREMMTGLKFIFTHSAVAFVMIAMTVGMFAVRSFGALVAVYVRDILRGDSTLFGVLNSMIGVGMILATQSIHRFGAKTEKRNLVVFGLFVAGVFILVLAAFGSVPMTFLGMLGLGFGVAFIFIPSQTLLQQSTPTDMLGRVSASMMSALAFTQVIALTLSGTLAEKIGIRNLYFGSAAMLVLLGVGGYARLRSERIPPPVPVPDAPSQS